MLVRLDVVVAIWRLSLIVNTAVPSGESKSGKRKHMEIEYLACFYIAPFVSRILRIVIRNLDLYWSQSKIYWQQIRVGLECIRVQSKKVSKRLSPKKMNGHNVVWACEKFKSWIQNYQDLVLFGALLHKKCVGLFVGPIFFLFPIFHRFFSSL
jgi:hypothetical protein